MLSAFHKIIWCTACWMASLTMAKAQSVSGTVRGLPDNRVLSGVSVSIAGNSGLHTITDNQGKYQLSVGETSDSILFSHVGFESQTASINKRSTLDIVLTPSNALMDQVVVVGYGIVKKTDLTGSVGTPNVSDMKKAPVTSFVQALAGRVAGVRVNSVDGQPGSGVNIMVRGAGSLTQSTAPLYVIDGFPLENFDPNTINMDDIVSISVLKDASSTSIYGARGANGVVLIQTKRGKVGKPEIRLGSSVGVQTRPPLVPVMDAYEFVKYQTELTPWSPEVTKYIAQGRSLDYYRDVKGIDWQHELIKPGYYQNYSLGMEGGTEQTKYSLSGSFLDHKGVVINTGMDRYTGRFTLDQEISKKFKAGARVAIAKTHTYGEQIRSIYAGGNATASALIRAWMYRPVAGVGNEDINLLTEEADLPAISKSDFRVNPIVDLKNQYQHTYHTLLQPDVYVSYTIAENLVLRGVIGMIQSDYRSEQYFNKKTAEGSPANPANTNGVWGTLNNTRFNGFYNENTLNYTKKIGSNHTFNGLLLFGMNQYKTSGLGLVGNHLPNEVKRMDGLDESPGGTFVSPSISSSVNSMVSYAGRIDYNFRSKYLLTLNFRADGSSKFMNPWGYFPGVAVAWNMSKESLFKQAFPFIDNSKLRMSYGQNGNNRIGDFEAYPQLTLNNKGQGYSFNNQSPIAAAYISNLGNALLKWEKTEQIDIGYELALFKNRIAIEVDWYRRTSTNLLLNATLPASSGFGSAQVNIGSLRNTGWEFTLNAVNIKTKDFKWASSFNISFNKNKIVSLAYGQLALTRVPNYLDQFGQPLYLSAIGRPVGLMIGYIWDGNYQYEDFDNPSPGVYLLKSSVSASGTARQTIQPGDIKLRDLNNDGLVNAADITIIGRGHPVHIGGFSNNFSYKRLSLNVFFQWSAGNNIYNANRLLLEGNSNGFALINQYQSYANRWSPENPTNENYRTGGQGFIGYFTTKNLEDGSYLRLKTTSLTYSLPDNWIRKAYFKNLSVDVSAQNLITWTKYRGMDPDVSVANNVLQPGWDFSAYPNTRTIVFGLKATF